MRSLIRGALLLLLVAGWLNLAPTQLGGRSTYVTTHGNSMAPRISQGDLVLVRAASDYRVGDSTAYWSDQLGRVVLHRIVAIEGDRYVFQGDNNSWLDPDRPTDDQLIGTELLHIPRGGIWLDRITSPTTLGFLALGLLATGGTAARSRHHRRRRTVSQHVARSHEPRRTRTHLPDWARTSVAVAGIAGVLGVVLGALAWTTPTMSGAAPAVVGDDSEQSMTFSYAAEVPASPAYDDTTVTAPQPIFRKLTDDVVVEYTYRGKPGSVSVTAELSTASGWQSTMLLARPQEFTEDHHTGKVHLDLEVLERRAQAAAEATGIPATQVDVTVVPTITSDGAEPFAAELGLSLTPLQLTHAGDASSLTDGRSPDSASTTTAAGPTTATVGLAGREIEVPTARVLSLVLSIGAALSAAVVLLLARVSAPTTETAAIQQRYPRMLVRVEPIVTSADRPVIDVVDFATLAKLAERYELMILHWSHGAVDTYAVQDQGTMYRYRTGEGLTQQLDERACMVV